MRRENGTSGMREDVFSRRGIGRVGSEVFSWSKIVGSKITGQLYIYVIIEEGVEIECIKGRSWKLVEYSVSGTIYHHL